MVDDICEFLWKHYIEHIKCSVKERCYLFISKSGNATSNPCDVKCKFGMPFRIIGEIIDIWFYSFNTTLHCRYGVGLSLHSHSLAHYCAETLAGYSCGASGMITGEVTAEYKYLIAIK